MVSDRLGVKLPRCKRASCQFLAHSLPAPHWEGYCCGACKEGFGGWKGGGHGMSCQEVLAASVEPEPAPLREKKAVPAGAPAMPRERRRCKTSRCGFLAHSRPEEGWRGYCCGACREGIGGFEGTGHGQLCQQHPWAAPGPPPAVEATADTPPPPPAWRPMRCRTPGCRFHAHEAPEALWAGHCCGACFEGFGGWKGSGHGKACGQRAWEEPVAAAAPEESSRRAGAAGPEEEEKEGDEEEEEKELRPREPPASPELRPEAARQSAKAEAEEEFQRSATPAPSPELPPQAALQLLEAPAPAVAKRERRGNGAKIAILARGSRGDIQPVAALAVRLKEDGYRVLMLCNDNYGDGTSQGHADFLQSLGLEVEVFPWDNDGATGERQCFIFDKVKAFRPALLLYWWLLALEAWVIEEKLCIPAVEYNLGILTSSKQFGFVLHLTQGAQKHRLDKHVGRLTLIDVRDVDDVRTRFWKRPRPALYACSRHIVKREDMEKIEDMWPDATATAGVHLTGYWLLDSRMQMRLVEAGNSFLGGAQHKQLEAFIEGGEPPVYIGWGSTGCDMHQDDFLGLLAVRTLRLAGKRGVVLGSYSNLGPASLDGADNSEALKAFAREKVFWAKWAPHEWLFPRCCTLVIHGGCNTTAAGLRSGRPMVITPIAHDQPEWAERVERLGVGVRTEHLRSVTPSELAAKLKDCESPAVAEACRSLAEKLQAEDGVGNAVDLLTAYLQTEPEKRKS